jgi:hypothetical protein
MYKIDLISQSPKNYIFQKESNETNVGGLLTIIYCFLAILIFVSYSYRYYSNNKYEITSFISGEKTLNEIQKLKFRLSDNYNPNMKLRFSLVDLNGKNLSDRFILYDYRNHKLIEREAIIQKRINDVAFYVLYKCKNKSEINCEVEGEDRSVLYNLKIEYQGYLINPYNNTPILKLSKDSFHSIGFNFNPDIKLRTFFKWNIIRFEDSKYLLKFVFDKIKDIFFNAEKEDDIIKEKDIYIGGNLKGDDTIIISKLTYIPHLNHTRLMFMFESKNNYDKFLYDDYIRKENYLLDVLADVFALLLSFYNILSFLFYLLYSQSYDKYKIMENILSIRKNNSFQ